jgi:hypothetical protein
VAVRAQLPGSGEAREAGPDDGEPGHGIEA